MWLMTPTAFLSIVDKAENPKNLVVRARREGDIQAVFPDADVNVTPGVDYLYRAEIDRETVAKAVADQVMRINYPNHKGATRDDALHSAYTRVWHAMAVLQPIAPYAARKLSNARRQNGLF